MTGRASQARILSFMNLKGGTGKTTLAIAVAEAMCVMFGKRIVLVDCDFQSSASITLLGRGPFNDLLVRRRTLDCAVINQIENSSQARVFDCVVPAHLAVAEAAGRLSILPASPGMPRSERVILSHFLRNGDLEKAYLDASCFIANEIRELASQYDMLIIDCPPGVTLFSEAAMKACDCLLVPTLPNEISIRAIDHLRQEMERITPDKSFDELHLGTLVSKIRHRNAAEHYGHQLGSIQGLLDRMPPSFMLLRPYLPFCRELESAGWRDAGGERIPFAMQYGAVARSIEQIAFAVMQRMAGAKVLQQAA
jgi:chromosome partitioning protein